ncbi:unnamed protein product [Prunus armeniaca]|uniref:Uncharacterized protein n=1 Tax=Prunus armeniaca TaxID=36596 RepID=A0A6J5WZ64_PRUAR|nr:unnamed protein product [Prunus armeniaca]
MVKKAIARPSTPQLQVDQYSMTWTRKDKNQEFQSKQFQIHLTQNERRRTTCPLPPPSPRQTRQIKVEKAKEKASALLKRRKTTAMVNKAADRYHSDPDYRFLHDRVSDLMAECLKHDIQQFNQHQQQRREHGQKKKKMKKLEFNITDAADCFRFVPPPMDQLLYETVARNVFSPGESQSEFSNPMSLQRLLRKEILVPLRQALAPEDEEGVNKWGYYQRPVYDGEPDVSDVLSASAARKYMVGRKGGESHPKPSAAFGTRRRSQVQVQLYAQFGGASGLGEQMVRKVFVFTCFKHFRNGCWKPRGGDYEEIQRKFEEKGYAVPHLVIWNLLSVRYAPLRTGEPGVTLLGGFSDAMLKSFLENDGELSPEQVMELAISPQSYQTLAVFD